MAGNRTGGLKAAQKNLASNPNFYAEIGRKGGSATFASHGSYKGFAQDIECDCDLIDGPHFVKKCAGKKGRSYKQTKINGYKSYPVENHFSQVGKLV